MSWVEKKTMDGLLYWYNPSTKAATWEKPMELRSEDEKAEGDWTWVPHPKDFWQPARVVSRNADGSVETQTKDGQTCVVPASKTMNEGAWTDGREQMVPLWPLKQFTLGHVEDDLIFLDAVNDGSIIYNLKASFAKQGLYTWVGASHRVLVSINPYQRLPIYGEDTIRLHRDKSPNIDVPPHVFDISDGSYNEMLFEGKHQSILISGESGAGKTEATKQCLKYWAQVAGSKNGVEERLIQANPVLEAYGNAKTIRNNNSSRFGKWVEVYFDQIARSIDGAVIINYLLEKSRLVFQQGGERNFHIFYQLLNDSSACSTYSLKSVSAHKLVCQGLTGAVEGVDDRSDFADAKQGMKELGFSAEETEWCCRLPAALLHLGDVEFAEATQKGNVRGSKVSDDAPLKLAAKFLDVDAEALRNVVVNRTIVVNREKSTIPLDPAAAKAGSQSIVKGIYSKLFDWIVARVNQSLTGGQTGKFIGVLDIFGFEIFEVNSFEQLCINFCNEKLQQLFNIETFRDEEQLYKDEGITYDPISFIDSDPVLAMIEKGPQGILPVLDDECKLPEGSDKKYMEKVNKAHADHPNFGSATARKLKNELSFDVLHYAGTVNYTADEFMDKNKDTFFQDAHDMAGSSSHALTKALFPSLDARLQVKSLSSVFRSQLNVLMEKLKTTSTRYIRCIKPNESMAALLFEAPLVMRQLRYSGVFEAVAIRKQGYPFRQKFAAFAFRYRTINPDHVYRETDAKKVCEEILSTSPTDFSDVVFGKTMVFYKSGTYKTLKLLRNLALETIIPRVQGILRGSLARAEYKRLKQLEAGIDAAIGLKTDYGAVKDALAAVDSVLGTLTRVFPDMRPRNEAKGKEYLAGLQLWMDEELNMTEVLKTPIGSSYAKYWEAFERCQKVLHVARSSKQQSLYDEVEKAIRDSEQGQVDVALMEATSKMFRAEMQSGVAKAQGMGHSSSTTAEAQRRLALGPKDWYTMEKEAAQACNDAARVATCTHRLWEIDMFAVGSQYERWGNFDGLKDPKEYAKGKWFGKAACAEGMCMASKDVVNSSLSKADLSPDFKKQAKEMNKAVLGYVGAKKDPRSPEAAAAEALMAGARSNNMKDELYLQILKCLSPNPKQPALNTEAGYELLGVALYSFPPQSEELHKYAFTVATKKDKKYAMAASNGKFLTPGAPKGGADVSRITGEVAGFGNEGMTALSLT